MPDEMIPVDYDDVVRESDKAILFDLGDWQVWLPKSQIEIESKRTKDRAGVVLVPAWLAEEKGLV